MESSFSQIKPVDSFNSNSNNLIIKNQPLFYRNTFQKTIYFRELTFILFLFLFILFFHVLGVLMIFIIV
jgi:hypothetical protein